MNVFFAGTPQIAVAALEAIAKKFNICGVLTNPDKPAGRKNILTAPPVKEKAIALGLKIFQPEILDNSFIECVKSLNPDVLVAFAYGKIFKKDFLDIFKKETLNIHPSLLPRFRGASPISAAILAGDNESGITVQQIALKMDSGNIVKQVRFPLTGRETLQSLSSYVADASAHLIADVLAEVESGCYSTTPQNESDALYCKLVKKEDGAINWSESASLIERKSRAYNPCPSIFTSWKGKTIVITDCAVFSGSLESSYADERPGVVLKADKKNGILVKTGDGALVIKKLKPQSKNEMDFSVFLNGARDFIGAELV